MSKRKVPKKKNKSRGPDKLVGLTGGWEDHPSISGENITGQNTTGAWQEEEIHQDKGSCGEQTFTA